MSRVGFGVGWIWVGGGVGNGRPLQVRARSPEKVCPQMTQICADGPEPRPATPSSHRHAGGCRHPRLLAFRTIGLVAPNLDRDAAGPLPGDSRCARDAISYRPMTVRCTVDIRTVLEPEANMSSRGQKAVVSHHDQAVPKTVEWRLSVGPQLGAFQAPAFAEVLDEALSAGMSRSMPA